MEFKITDRELLLFAAKAAKIELWHEDVFTDGLTRKVNNNGILRWNPLVDDGDAFRLAATLGIHFIACDTYTWASHPSITCVVPVSYDLYKAARRAVVKVAAEIGRNNG